MAYLKTLYQHFRECLRKTTESSSQPGSRNDAIGVITNQSWGSLPSHVVTIILYM
jgi:hypothetical protein